MMIWHKWAPIAPLDGNCGYDFSAIDSLHRQWLEFKQAREAANPDAYTEFIARLTRSWAIETGIIEGLYTIDRGLTATLVQCGISAELIAHGSANKSPYELAQVLGDHQHTTEGIYAEIRAARPITRSAIRQMHAAITASQPSYRAVDQFGRWFDKPLQRGGFKTLPNNPTRNDGMTHEYCPPEHVDSEMDNLLTWYGEYIRDTDRYHPLLTAAWLHHRFTQIHPFEDGNGRVVRALLAWHLVRENYLPVVVTRDDRDAYIRALESADAGRLTPFVDLLAKLQRRTILEAIGAPAPPAPPGAFDQVLAHLVGQLGHHDAELATRRRRVNAVAASLRDAAATLLDARGNQAVSQLAHSGLTVSPDVLKGGPDLPEREHRYRRQIISTAASAKHWVNFSESQFLVRLTLTPPSPRLPRLVFVVSLHHAGRQLTGIMAAAAFALIEHYDDYASAPAEELEPPPTIDCTLDPFTFTGDNDADALLPHFSEWIDQRLAIALRQWGEYLS